MDRNVTVDRLLYVKENGTRHMYSKIYNIFNCLTKLGYSYLSTNIINLFCIQFLFHIKKNFNRKHEEKKEVPIVES